MHYCLVKEKIKVVTYYIIFLIIGVLLFLGRTKQFQQFKKVNFFLVGAILMLVSGLHYTPGGDYLAYSIEYEQAKISGFFSGIPIASVLIANLSQLIYDDYATWFFIYAIITVGGISYTLYRRSINFEYSILLFIFMGMWHESFNVVKQYAAIAVLFWAQQFLFTKNLKKWVLSCLGAMCFHPTAILMIPAYFLVTTKVNVKKVIAYVFIAIVLAISYEYLFEVASFLKADTAATALDSDVGSRSVSLLRIVVNCIPAIFYLLMREFHGLKKSNELTVWANFSLLNAMIFIAGSQSVYVTRFSLYTAIFGTLLYPYLLSEIRDRKIRFIVGIIILIAYFIFWNVDVTKTELTSNFQWIFDR